MKPVWFSDRNYSLLYIHRFFFVFAEFAATTYRPGYFLAHHMTLPFIILSVALLFGTSALISPYAYKFTSRHSIGFVFTAAAFFNVVSYGMAGQVDYSLTIAFLSNIFAGLACGLYYSVSDILEALYVSQSDHRGRQYSFGSAISTLGMALGVMCCAFILPIYGFTGLTVISIFSFGIALVPIFLLPKKLELKQDARALDVLVFIKKPEYRSFYIPLFGLQLWIIMQIFVPLFLYLIIGDMKILGLIVGIAVFLQFIVTILFGHHIDISGHKKALWHSLLINAVTVAGFMVLAVNPFTAFFVESWNRLGYNALNSAFMTMLQEKNSFPRYTASSFWGGFSNDALYI